ncbi:MAG TPA: hypothetical protein VET85_08765 [Stellaceae bacterium]|nr:hypothetical protein [Stellaceae bacterium]
MSKWTAAALSAVLLAGCSGVPTTADRDNAAIAVGTPFYLAAKIPVCVATVAIAAPIIGIGQLAKPTYDRSMHTFQPSTDDDLRRTMRDGITDNCGPPYAVTP